MFELNEKKPVDKQVKQWLQSFRKTVPAPILAICSGKGGVGKTSITLKMAKAFSHQNKKVLVIDGDYNLSNTTVKLGLPLDRDFLKVLENPKLFHKYIKTVDGFDLLPSCNGEESMLDQRHKLTHLIVQIVSDCAYLYDLILIDCPAGLHKDGLGLTALADHRLYVITPDPSSLTDGYSLYKILLERYGCSNHFFLVNQFQNELQCARVKRVFESTAQRFTSSQPQFLGGLPEILVDHQQFDQLFLSSEISAFHDFFLKIMNNINEAVFNQDDSFASESVAD